MSKIFILDKEHQNEFYISEISDPIIREICFMGFIVIEENVVYWKLKLYDKNKNIFEIDLSEFRNIICGLKIKRGLHLNGRIYYWISDATGDGDRLRDFIKQKTSNQLN